MGSIIRAAIHLALGQRAGEAVLRGALPPGLKREEGFGVEGEEAALVLGAGVDHAGLTQDGEGARDTGLGDPCGLGEGGDSGPAAPEGGNDVAPGRVRLPGGG